MIDTSPGVKAFYRERLMALPGKERFLRGALMFEAAREMIFGFLPEGVDRKRNAVCASAEVLWGRSAGSRGTCRRQRRLLAAPLSNPRARDVSPEQRLALGTSVPCALPWRGDPMCALVSLGKPDDVCGKIWDIGFVDPYGNRSAASVRIEAR